MNEPKMQLMLSFWNHPFGRRAILRTSIRCDGPELDPALQDFSHPAQISSLCSLLRGIEDKVRISCCCFLFSGGLRSGNRVEGPEASVGLLEAM